MNNTVFDPANDVFGIELVPFKTTAAVTRGSAVCVDSNGDVADSATATLSRVIGVAYENIDSGSVGRIQTKGYCDYLVTDEGLATDDVRIQALNGGISGGITETEITADPTLAYNTFAIALGVADEAAVGKCYITGGGYSGGGATS